MEICLDESLDLLPLEMTAELKMTADLKTTSDLNDSEIVLNIHFWVFDYSSYLRAALFDQWFNFKRLQQSMSASQIENYKKRSRYFKTDSRPFVNFTVTINGSVFRLTSDHQGHVYARIPVSLSSLLIDSRLPITYRGQMKMANVTVNQYHSQKRRLLISDIDDTIKITEVTDKSRMLENTFLNDFIEVPGMGAKYSSLVATGTIDHLYYVSSSPWQLYPSLSQFLDQYGFPQTGNIFLRKLVDNEIDTFVKFATNSFEYKIETIQNIIAQQRHTNLLCTCDQLSNCEKCSNLEVVLVGDAGEKDPEIYNNLALMYPGIIVKIIIRVFGESIEDRFSPSVYPLVATYTSAMDFPSKCHFC